MDFKENETVQLKKNLHGDMIPIIPNKTYEISEVLLEDILHELNSINGLYACDFLNVDLIQMETNAGKTFFKLDMIPLIKKIKKVME